VPLLARHGRFIVNLPSSASSRIIVTDRNFNPRRSLILGLAWHLSSVFVTLDRI